MSTGVKFVALPGVCSGGFLWNFKGQDYNAPAMKEQTLLTSEGFEDFLKGNRQTKFLLIVYDHPEKTQKNILDILKKWSERKEGYVAKYLNRWTPTAPLWMIREVLAGSTWEEST